jgi:hypothetical protein
VNQSSARTRYTTALFPGVPWKCLMLKTANVQTIGDGPAASVDRRRARLRRRPGLPMCDQIRDRGTCRFGLLPWGRLRLAWWLSVSGPREWIRPDARGAGRPVRQPVARWKALTPYHDRAARGSWCWIALERSTLRAPYRRRGCGNVPAPCRTWLTSLVAFVAEHQPCGDLDGGRDSGYVWLACSCGARIAHPATTPPPAPARTAP